MSGMFDEIMKMFGSNNAVMQQRPGASGGWPSTSEQQQSGGLGAMSSKGGGGNGGKGGGFLQALSTLKSIMPTPSTGGNEAFSADISPNPMFQQVMQQSQQAPQQQQQRQIAPVGPQPMPVAQQTSAATSGVQPVGQDQLMAYLHRTLGGR